MSKHISPDMIIVGAGGGVGSALLEAKNHEHVLIAHDTKEARQLNEILELDRGITITASHPFFMNKKERPKKSFWKNGKLRYK